MAVLIYSLWPGRGDGAFGSGATMAITPANFEQEVLLSSDPVLAYFWAPW
jgi:thioredoxin-like negative regulator of GroEL